MRKYIALFTSTVPDLVKRLDTALSEKDFAEIANQVHSYKTKWIMMGMKETKDLALKIELQCREESPSESVKENISRLIAQIQTAASELT